ncbi:MAG: type I 3-dehydroquinate dehydratase [Clostridia bacterium]|nr:type I 3-dehydroquinate dehydratase [Clostridia bacterium]
MKKTFLNREKPLLTCMVQADNPDRIKELVEHSLPEGAEAFGMQFCRMKPQYRRREVYRELFEFVSPLPTYVTNYRACENAGVKSDDVLAEELLELAECGATLCDVMGDCFDPCEGELTLNEAAVEKQRRLIDAIHARGAEVLMSSHVLKFLPAERVLEIAFEHQRRGADICKIVTGASSMAEQIENLRIIDLLKRELKIPFLFLCGGECHLLRRVGGTLGNCMSLCVHEYDAVATKVQPLLKDMKRIRDDMKGSEV